MGVGKPGKDGLFLGTNLIEPVYPDAKSPTSFRDGIEFQDFVCHQLALRHVVLQNLSSKKYQLQMGENLQGFEIKKDDWCTTSKRLSIEIAEKSCASMPNWTPSGIMRKDNTWLYIQGNYSKIFIFAKNWLVRWYEQKAPELEDKPKLGPTVRTFYLPFSVAEVMAALVIDIAQ